MRLFDVPIELKQPNGEIINCFASGDEHFNWAHDRDGHIIVKDINNGFYTYANYVNEKLIAGPIIVKNDPLENVVIAQANQLENLVTIKDVKIKPEDLFYYDVPEVESFSVPYATSPTGTINNIVIFIRFSDQSEFTDSVSKYQGYFNDSTSGQSSVYNYFQSTSYGSLFINSTLYPTTLGTTVISYQDANPRSYYIPYDTITNPGGYLPSQRTSREHILLKNAVDSISSQVPTALVLDNDGDGRIDDVTFIIQGGATDWNTLLWPHQWSLFSVTATINDLRVWSYNFELNDMLDVSVICHETQHVIGFPDLYNYTWNPVNPVGSWDIMNANSDPPQYSLAYAKYKYGHWLTTIPEITINGTYVLNPLSNATSNAYMFKGQGPSTEFFVVEYRKEDNIFENSLPGSGLIVSRIDTTVNGNAGGPPNGIYVFRPGGTTIANGALNNAYLSLESGRTSIGDEGNPIFYSDGTSSGIVISNVSSAGATISFGIVVTTVVADMANVTITKSADKLYATIGDTIAYTVVMKNIGNVTALNVIIVDTIPNGTSFVSGVYQYNGVTSTIGNPIAPGINVGSIGIGATSTITMITKIN